MRWSTAHSHACTQTKRRAHDEGVVVIALLVKVGQHGAGQLHRTVHLADHESAHKHTAAAAGGQKQPCRQQCSCIAQTHSRRARVDVYVEGVPPNVVVRPTYGHASARAAVSAPLAACDRAHSTQCNSAPLRNAAQGHDDGVWIRQPEVDVCMRQRAAAARSAATQARRIHSGTCARPHYAHAPWMRQPTPCSSGSPYTLTSCRLMLLSGNPAATSASSRRSAA